MSDVLPAYFQSSVMTPRYLTWSFCSREEMVLSLVGKIMFNGVFHFLWADLINMKFLFSGFIESFLCLD